MIVLGSVILAIGLITGISIISDLGGIALAFGAILLIAGSHGHAPGDRLLR